MLLGRISNLDCIAFVTLLVPQLLLQAGPIETLKCAAQSIPFFVLRMPYELIKERYLTEKGSQSVFVQQASFFQDLVVRCVRFAFARLSPAIGKVFFSKQVAIPFYHFRKLRHGIIRSPIHWEELSEPGLKGIWIVEDPYHEPDIVVYYCHGGGFSMGSSYFYLEFLIAYVAILRDAGYRNPGLFALEYTLTPKAAYPTQLEEVQTGYRHVMNLIRDPARIVVSGDSAGGTLILSLLLSLTNPDNDDMKRPGLATLISPWTTILSPENRNTKSDYLDAAALDQYGRQYLGKYADSDDPVASPGTCHDLKMWERASPRRGYLFIYGAAEVFAPEARRMVKMLSKADIHAEKHEDKAWVHAWPVAKLFLGDTQADRTSGLRRIVQAIKARIPIETHKKP